MRGTRWTIFSVLCLLVGCQSKSTVVYVDLDRVPVSNTHSIKLEAVTVAGLPASPSRSFNLESLPRRIIRVDRKDAAADIKSILLAEARKAEAVIASRLRDFYSTEIEDFIKEQTATLSPQAAKVWSEYRDKVRPIFESYSKRREPLLVKITILSDFPNPDDVVTPDPKSDPALQARATKLRALQLELQKIDAGYDAQIAALIANSRGELGGLESEISGLIERKRAEINVRAEREATAQVQRTSADLNEQLVAMGAKALPELPGKTMTIAAKSASAPVKGVPSSSRNLVPEPDVHRQLQIWLALNKYDLADSASGAKDVTEEFVKWRAAASTH